jgi:RNA polymerase sigma-70 factor (ECF subfamily)
MEERQSIARLKGGDIGGLEALARKYYLPAVRAAFLVVRDQELAEDIVQTSFLNLTTKIKQFDETKDFRPWFFRSIVNSAISDCRTRKRSMRLSDDDESHPLASIEKLIGEGESPEEEYISEETRAAVWQALEELSPQQRAAVVLKYYLELSENEITEELQRPKSTVKWLLFSARQKLRRLLEPDRSGENCEDNRLEAVLQREERI